MTTLDVPRDGHATFKRLGARGLSTMLLREERCAQVGLYLEPSERHEREEAVLTFLRPIAYLARELGT